MSGSPSSEIYERIGRNIVERAIQQASGQDTPYCIGATPSRQYYVSNLTPQRLVDDDGSFTETQPSSIGIQVSPQHQDATLTIEFAFELYIRCLPTYEEYVEETDDEFDPTSDAFYRRCRVTHVADLDLTALNDSIASITTALNDRVDDAVKSVTDERVLHPEESITEAPLSDLVGFPVGDRYALTDHEYGELCDTLADLQGVRHDWELSVDVDVRDGDLTVRLVNEVPAYVAETRAQVEPESAIFNPEIRISGTLEPYELDVVSEDFRYNREVWGKGVNCTVTLRDDEDEQTVQTDVVPSHQTHRFVHRGEEDRFEADIEHLIDLDETFDTELEHLWQGDTVSDLHAIADGMRSYLTEWTGALRRERRDEFSPDELNEYDAAAQEFRTEIDNFERGIDVLANQPKAMQAFSMMNRAFAEQPDEHGIPGWRLFQLVFIVSNVPSIVAREFDVEEAREEEAEMLWFPTGGGKTEAYMGLVVFALFFDRLRGKEGGVTSWIRFPLTLLGSQQLRRFLRILTYANSVKEDLGLPGEEFSIGYYAGSHTTPNRIGGRNNLDDRFEGPNGQAELKRECKVVEECPRCGDDVDIEWLPEVHAVRHSCTNDDCAVGRLPLYVTDHEIYRYVPSVLLGTLDKITVVGSNPRFANLIGNLTTECPIHGYGYSGKCSENSTTNCSHELKDVEDQVYDPVPTLHLVDEVHLLGEELGVFAGHYETLFLELCEQIGDTAPKIVTSTATISDRDRGDGVPAYERHMQNLFQRPANRFPVDGPELGESFYGTTTEERLRRYYGIAPRNKTHIYAVLDLVKQFHQVVRDFHDMSADDFDVTAAQKDEVLSMYELSIVYFLKLTEKDRFVRSINNQIEREMQDDGYDLPIELTQLTGDVDDPDLEGLESTAGAFADRTDMVAATSFIGHGVDVSRFNNMFFFGFPSRTFQYIQSSNRVGREVPGFVVDVFKPFDQRDAHRYKYFHKTHEYLDRAVEDVSVDRWSKFSLDKTFPGLLKGFFLQYFRPLMYREYDLNVQSSAEFEDVIDPDSTDSFPELTRERLQEMLRRAYGVGEGQDDRPYFVDEIESRVESNWEYWLTTGTRENWTEFRDEEMRSLRDIGEDGEISVTSDEANAYSSLLNN